MTSLPVPVGSVPPPAARPSAGATSAVTPSDLDVGHEFFRPRSAVWWLYCLAVGLGAPGITLAVADSFTMAKTSLWTIAPLFVITLALFAALVLWADPYRARRPWILALSSLFGATVATWLAIHGNAHLVSLTTRLLPEGVGADWAAAVAGPSTEEWGKMLGTCIIMLIAWRTLRRPMHGLLVGAFVGLGFQIFENVSYAANNAPADANSDLTGALSVTVLRSIIGVSSHWLYTAITGVGVAFLLGRTLKHYSRAQRILRFLGLYALGWGLHFWWNAPAGSLTVALLPVKVVVAIIAFLLVARIAWRQEREYLAHAETEVAPYPVLAAAAADPVLHSAAGTRKQRRRGLKRAKKEGGRAGKKEARRLRRRYLDALQALGRRGTGVDEYDARDPQPLRRTHVKTMPPLPASS